MLPPLLFCIYNISFLFSGRGKGGYIFFFFCRSKKNHMCLPTFMLASPERKEEDACLLFYVPTR